MTAGAVGSSGVPRLANKMPCFGIFSIFIQFQIETYIQVTFSEEKRTKDTWVYPFYLKGLFQVC
ncbi:hypothetical protein VIBNISFn135_820067 [Vibrio nigripulchritudo SFn135]|nr:hypothetical protein VIBNISFn135_820067 [Vibrio nigripulchritudo SFn135]